MHMRLALVCLIVGLASSASGCGGGGDPVLKNCVDVGGADCWEMPTDTLKKRDTETASNFTCAPAVVEFSNMDINVTGVGVDFQTMGVLDGATVDAFQLDDLSFTTSLGTATTAMDGTYGFTLASGAGSRLNWRTRHSGALDTYAINVPLDINMADVMSNRAAVSLLSANAIPALVGTTRTSGLGAVSGGVVDCDGDQVRNAIATVSSTSGAGNTLPTFVAGAQVYYFMGPLPVNRSTLTATAPGGTLVVLEIPPGTAFFQIWGFVDQADVAMGESGLTLISEFESPVIGDAVLSIGMEPTENL